MTLPPAPRGCCQGTFSCDEINASTCVLSWCAHYQTSDPAMLKGMLEEMIGGALAAIAESATASGGRKAISWPTKTPTVKGSCNCGAVSYVLDTNKLVLNAYCYCKDCQQAHGSICTAATIVPNDGIEWTGLETNVERFNRAEHEGVRPSAPSFTSPPRPLPLAPARPAVPRAAFCTSASTIAPLTP